MQGNSPVDEGFMTKNTITRDDLRRRDTKNIFLGLRLFGVRLASNRVFLLPPGRSFIQIFINFQLVLNVLQTQK